MFFGRIICYFCHLFNTFTGIKLLSMVNLTDQKKANKRNSMLGFTSTCQKNIMWIVKSDLPQKTLVSYYCDPSINNLYITRKNIQVRNPWEYFQWLILIKQDGQYDDSQATDIFKMKGWQ